MESKKDKWIEEVIASGLEMNKMHAPVHLYANILNQLNNKPKTVSFGQFRIMLAAASIFAVVNIAVFFYANKQVSKPQLSAYSVETYNLDLY